MNQFFSMNQSNLSRKIFIRLYFSYKKCAYNILSWLFRFRASIWNWKWLTDRGNIGWIPDVTHPAILPGSTGVLENDATNKQKQKHPQLNIWQTIQCVFVFARWRASTVTIYNVFLQRWEMQPITDISDGFLNTMANQRHFSWTEFTHSWKRYIHCAI